MRESNTSKINNSLVKRLLILGILLGSIFVFANDSPTGLENPRCEAHVLNLVFEGDSLRSHFSYLKKTVNNTKLVYFKHKGDVSLTESEIGQLTVLILRTWDQIFEDSRKNPCNEDYQRIFIVFKRSSFTISKNDLDRMSSVRGRGLWERHLWSRIQEFDHEDINRD